MSNKIQRYFFVESNLRKGCHGGDIFVSNGDNFDRNIEEYIYEVYPKAGEEVTVFEIIPVAKYRITSGFKKV